MAFGWDIDDDDGIYDGDEMGEEDNEHPFGEDEDLNDEHSTGKREDVSAQEAADEEEQEMSQHHSGSGVNLDYKGGLGDPTEDAKMEREREAMLDSYRNKNTRVDDDVIDGDKIGQNAGKNQYDIETMMKIAKFKKMGVRPSRVCPICKQKSIYNEKSTCRNLKKVAMALTGNFSKINALNFYMCLNPACKANWQKHKKFFMTDSNNELLPVAFPYDALPGYVRYCVKVFNILE